MQAYELKSIADKANKDAADPQIEEAYRRVIVDLKDSAKYGSYTRTIFLSTINIQRPLWEKVATLLRKDGFTVSFDTEITAWYTNTDWDQEDVIKISWL